MLLASNRENSTSRTIAKAGQSNSNPNGLIATRQKTAPASARAIDTQNVHVRSLTLPSSCGCGGCGGGGTTGGVGASNGGLPGGQATSASVTVRHRATSAALLGRYSGRLASRRMTRPLISRGTSGQKVAGGTGSWRSTASIVVAGS